MIKGKWVICLPWVLHFCYSNGTSDVPVVKLSFGIHKDWFQDPLWTPKHTEMLKSLYSMAFNMLLSSTLQLISGLCMIHNKMSLVVKLYFYYLIFLLNTFDLWLVKPTHMVPIFIQKDSSHFQLDSNENLLLRYQSSWQSWPVMYLMLYFLKTVDNVMQSSSNIHANAVALSHNDGLPNGIASPGRSAHPDAHIYYIGYTSW